MWNLYCCKLTEHGHKRYIWVKDEIIQFSRVIEPYGWLKQEINPFNVEFIGKNRKDKSITDYFHFKKVNTEMTQEELSKGWLCL